MPLTPSTPDQGVGFNSISCFASNGCIGVGFNGFDSSPCCSNVPFIASYDSGSWSVQDSPVPADAATGPEGGLPLLNTIDCVDSDNCTAGGAFMDSQNHQQAMFVTLSDGKWTATEATLPSASSSNLIAVVDGVSCPAVDACVADGSWWPTYPEELPAPIIFTQQSDGSWTASEPSTTVTSGGVRHNGKRVSPKVVLSGVACATPLFCRAVGTSGSSALIEKMTRR